MPNSLRFWVKNGCHVHSCNLLVGPMVTFQLPWTPTINNLAGSLSQMFFPSLFQIAYTQFRNIFYSKAYFYSDFIFGRSLSYRGTGVKEVKGRSSLQALGISNISRQEVTKSTHHTEGVNNRKRKQNNIGLFCLIFHKTNKFSIIASKQKQKSMMFN